MEESAHRIVISQANVHYHFDTTFYGLGDFLHKIGSVEVWSLYENLLLRESQRCNPGLVLRRVNRLVTRCCGSSKLALLGTPEPKEIIILTAKGPSVYHCHRKG